MFQTPMTESVISSVSSSDSEATASGDSMVSSMVSSSSDMIKYVQTNCFIKCLSKHISVTFDVKLPCV